MKLLTLILTSDKTFHFLAGFFICVMFGLINPLIGLSAGVLAGIAKELFDKYYEHETFDWWDLIATVVGTILAYLI